MNAPFLPFRKFLNESDSLSSMKAAADQLTRTFRFARNEGMDETGCWNVFVGEQDPKVLDSTLKSIGYEFFEVQDDLTGAVETGYMKADVSLYVEKSARIVASGTIVGYNIAIDANAEDLTMYGLETEEGDSGDGDSQDDTFTDNIKNHF